MHRTIIAITLTIGALFMQRAHAIADTIAAYPRGIKQLAAALDCSENLLYRAANPGPAGADISFGKIEKIIEITGDHRIVDWLNWRFGFTKIAPPDSPFNPPDFVKALEELQAQQIVSSSAARSYFDDPAQDTFDYADMSLLLLIGLAQGMRQKLARDWRHLAETLENPKWKPKTP